MLGQGMVLEHHQGKFVYKAIAIIGVIWLLCVSVIFVQYRQTAKMSDDVVELGNHIMSFHNSLHFRSPYRVIHTNDMSLNVQLIYSLRVQLEADYEDSVFQPDVTHLVYVIDKFIEKSQMFLSSDLDVLDMVEQLKLLRSEYENQPDIRRYYVELGAYLFEALFTEGEQSPEIYRSLDQIMVASQAMSPDDRQHLQLTLAKVSKLLSQYAESGNLVNRLLQHEIYQELHTLENEYFKLFGFINVLLLVLSGLLIASLLIVVIFSQRRCKHAVESLCNGEASSANEQSTDQNKGKKEVLTDVQHLPVAGTSVESKIDIPQMLSSLSDDKESVKMLLRVFIEDHYEDCEKLQMQISSDLGAAMRTAHSLKGVAGTIGANELRIIAIDIEAKLKREEIPTDEEIQNLTKSLDETVKSAQFWLEQASF
ncbi:Hpt domain-containing protein [Vibrio diazotrophicus]|uniref:Hpt domain-containing protein n=1 Tax=Vibrio diazotrophicus TaxID=685 RepID=UPI000C9E1401|nr:Hpt domain-containing protein [Vibrio diazotrophicus]PNH94595.1 Hpt domain-containing protein [Vibrio diazotrophicus]